MSQVTSHAGHPTPGLDEIFSGWASMPHTDLQDQRTVFTQN